MIRHMNFPKTLYRLQNSLRFKLKQGSIALQKGRTNFDYIINEHGLYMPRSSMKQDRIDFRPNGVQLFSMTQNFKEMLRSNLRGAPRYYYVVEIPQGTQLPEKTILFQDPVEDFVYWLQTQVPVEPKQFNSKVQLLLLKNKIHRKKQFKPLIAAADKSDKITELPVFTQQFIQQQAYNKVTNSKRSKVHPTLQ